MTLAILFYTVCAQTAEPLVPEPSVFEAELAIEK